MNYPIPEHLKDDFVGYMSVMDKDELPDGAWWCVLEDSAIEFMKEHKLKGDSNTATHQYLIWRSK
jgi:hypothetical protein